jgi:hypothetical protein
VIGEFQASPLRCRLAATPRRIERLLSTPPHGDAVTFGYGDMASSDTDSHRADMAPSWAHNEAAPRQGRFAGG